MSKRTIANLKSKEKQVFRANIKKFKAIINSSGMEENSYVIERTDCGLSSPESNNSLEDEINFDDPNSLIEEFQNISPNPNISKKKKRKVFQTDLNLISPKTYSVNADIASLLSTIIENQNKLLEHQETLKTNLESIENRLTTLESNHKDIIYQRSESMAQNTMLRECKVLIKRMHKSIRNITGEAEDENAVEIESTLPITSISQFIEVEEKLQNPEYEISMKGHIIKIKSLSGSLDAALRSLFTDAFISNYNVDGKFGKLSLIETHLVNKTLFDVFHKKGWSEFTKGLKKYVDLSHNRYRQRLHYGEKKTKKN